MKSKLRCSVLFFCISSVCTLQLFAECSAETVLGYKCPEPTENGMQYCGFHTTLKNVCEKDREYSYEDVISAAFAMARERLYSAQKKRKFTDFAFYLYALRSFVSQHKKLLERRFSDFNYSYNRLRWYGTDDLRYCDLTELERALFAARHSISWEDYTTVKQLARKQKNPPRDIIEECDAALLYILKDAVSNIRGDAERKRIKADWVLHHAKELSPQMTANVLKLVKDAKANQYGFRLLEQDRKLIIDASKGERVWRDRDGFVFNAVLEKDRTPPQDVCRRVLLYIPVEKKDFWCESAWLSDEDLEYVEQNIAANKSHGLVWSGSSWKNADEAIEEAREETYISEAKDYLNKNSPAHEISFQGIQVLGNGNAICAEYEKAFLWNRKSDGSLYDGLRFKMKMFYVGTYGYTTIKNVYKTVPMYVDDLNRAIFLIRKQNGLYAKGDDRFADSSGSDSGGDDSTQQTTPPHGLCSGSGFFISDDGYLLTNNHVIENAKSVKVCLGGDSNEPATIIAVDKKHDLALLKIDRSTKAISVAPESPVILGQEIFVIGFPRLSTQGFSPKLTRGVISSENGIQDQEDQYQIDASIQPGNSGGPVCDMKGRMVGVTVATLNSEYFIKQGGTVPQNVNYAVKRDVALKFLREHGAGNTFNVRKEDPNVHRGYHDAVKMVRDSVVIIIVET